MTNNPTPQTPGLDINALGNMLGGMNISGLSNMLGGANLSGLSNMLSGVNLNQLIQFIPLITQMMGGMKGLAGLAAPLMQNQGFGVQRQASIPQGFGQLPVQQSPASLFPPIPEPYLNDPRVLVLNIMKPFLPPDKIRILDSIIGVMAVIFTVNTVLPRRPAVAAVPVPPPAAPNQPIQYTQSITVDTPPPPPNAQISYN